MKKTRFRLLLAVAGAVLFPAVLPADTVVEEIIVRVNNEIITRTEYAHSRDQLVASQKANKDSEKMIADLLIEKGIGFRVYAGGYAEAVEADKNKKSPKPDADCTAGSLRTYPCIFTPSDIPFAYYPTVADKPEFFADDTSEKTTHRMLLPFCCGHERSDRSACRHPKHRNDTVVFSTGSRG